MSKLTYLICSILAWNATVLGEQTLSIIKPDGVKNHHIGNVIHRLEKEGLTIAAMKMVRLTNEQAASFYEVHKDKPFFGELTKFMSSGPIIVMVLEGDQAVTKNREIMGATDPKKAKAGTIRAELSKSMGENTVHGSDSLENAQKEIGFFFKPDEIVNSN